MGDNFSINKRYVIVKPEVTPGTMVTPVTGDHTIRIRNLAIDSIDVPMDDENAKYANGSHAEDESIATTQSISISFQTRVTYSGTVTTEPNWWALAKMCGMASIGWNGGSATTVGSAVEGISLVRRAAQDDTTYTVWVFDEEIGTSPTTTIWKAAGCVGNMQISAEIGQPLVASFNITGKLSDHVDGSAVAMSSAQTQLAESWLNSTTTIGGTAVCMSNFNLNMGNVVSPVYCQSDSTGISHYFISESRPRLTCNPLMVKQATTDRLNELLSETSQVVSIGTSNYTIKGIDCQNLSIADTPREGMVAHELNFKLLQNGVPGSLTDAALTIEDTVDILHGARS